MKLRPPPRYLDDDEIADAATTGLPDDGADALIVTAEEPLFAPRIVEVAFESLGARSRG